MNLLRDVHDLALSYHWSEREILALTLPRRIAYLSLLEEARDAALTSALNGGSA